MKALMCKDLGVIQFFTLSIKNKIVIRRIFVKIIGLYSINN
jgi:hypothetical protein